MKKTYTKVESQVHCQAAASLNMEIVADLGKKDGNLQDLLEKDKNDHECGKDTCKCSGKDERD